MSSKTHKMASWLSLLAALLLPTLALGGDGRMIGISVGLAHRRASDPCVGHRCDDGACPCGCECGDNSDPGLCYVPKDSSAKPPKLSIRWNTTDEIKIARLSSPYSDPSESANSRASQPNGIISIEPNGKASVLKTLPQDVAIFDSAFDHASQTLYMWWSVKAQILPYSLANNSLLQPVNVDLSKCEGGAICFNEIRWDSRHSKIVAVAMGFGGPQNAIVSIDPVTGQVQQISPSFSNDCALYLQCSAFDSISSTFFAWLSCDSTPTAQLYAISTGGGSGGSGGNTTLLNVSFRSVLGPMVYDQERKAPIGVGPDGKLYLCTANNSTELLSNQALGGIPADSGLVMAAGSSSHMAYASLVDLEKNKLAGVNLSGGGVSEKPLPYTVGQLTWVE